MGIPFFHAGQKRGDHAVNDVQGAVDDGKLDGESSPCLMDLTGLFNARFRDGGGIHRFVAVFDNGFHDLDFLFGHQHPPGHEIDHIGLIDDAGDLCNMVECRLYQLTCGVVIYKGGGTAHPKGIFPDPVLVPFGRVRQGLFH